MPRERDYDGVEGHWLNIGRYQRGKTAIRPTRPVYGTTATCSCQKWASKFNGAPTKGGAAAMRADHREHVKEVNGV